MRLKYAAFRDDGPVREQIETEPPPAGVTSIVNALTRH